MRIAPVLSLILALCICQAASATESCEYDNAAISALPVVTDVISTPVKQNDHSMMYTGYQILHGRDVWVNDWDIDVV